MAYNSKKNKIHRQSKKTKRRKRIAYKRIGLFMLGVLMSLLPNVIFDNWICYLGFILMISTSLYAWLSLKDLADIYFPVQKQIVKLKNIESFSIALVVFSIIFSIVLWEEDTRYYQSLVWVSVAIGMVAAIIVLYILSVFVQNIFTSYGRRFAIFNALFLSLPLLTIGSISHFNIALAEETVLCDNFILSDKSINEHDDYDSYYFHFFVDEKELRYNIDKETWDKFQFGDIIEVCFIDGYFGFEKIAFIDEYDPTWDKE